MNNLNFCFERTNFDRALNKAWCPECCGCPQWCSNGTKQTLNMVNNSSSGLCTTGDLDTRRICCASHGGNCLKSWGCKMNDDSGECVPLDN